MTVVPVAFQLASWIPAWWRADIGGDDILNLLPGADLQSLFSLREATLGVTAYCPALGVAALPGPKATTEMVVAAGQAVILHRGPGRSSTLMVPDGCNWRILRGDPTRPIDLDAAQAQTEFAQAVVRAEHDLREAAIGFGIPPRTATARPLPPGTPGPRRALLTTAVRIWTAIDAVPVAQRTESLTDALRAAARATLAAYVEPVTRASSPRHADRRLA